MTAPGTRPEDLSADPIEQFQAWFDDAVRAEIPLAEGMALATVNAAGESSCRIVLLKEISEGGFVFFTNYDSRKGDDIEANRSVALTFWWTSLERQIRIEGRASKVPAEVSDRYFATRPRGSQISAAISEQSRPVTGREVLEQEKRRLTEELEGKEVPRPLNWGGYRVMPERIEFWQGREDRLHDRFLYEREGDGWTLTRLAP